MRLAVIGLLVALVGGARLRTEGPRGGSRPIALGDEGEKKGAPGLGSNDSHHASRAAPSRPRRIECESLPERPKGASEPNKTVTMRSRGRRGSSDIQDVTHTELFELTTRKDVFVTKYTTWCPNCVTWQLPGGPLEQVVDLIRKDGHDIAVLEVNVEADDVDHDAMIAAGYESWFVPALFTMQKSVPGSIYQPSPQIYKGTSVDEPEVIYKWVVDSLNLNPTPSGMESVALKRAPV
mmetsp:Transcript_71893/g.211122  ORF Transcript_71893/g.211122 Transcript_71893/m.211122 type:complete len:236 (-) Transcript_71893:6-713(-)